jgi:hypothetical protein
MANLSGLEQQSSFVSRPLKVIKITEYRHLNAHEVNDYPHDQNRKKSPPPGKKK